MSEVKKDNDIVSISLNPSEWAAITTVLEEEQNKYPESAEPFVGMEFLIKRIKTITSSSSTQKD